MNDPSLHPKRTRRTPSRRSQTDSVPADQPRPPGAPPGPRRRRKPRPKAASVRTSKEKGEQTSTRPSTATPTPSSTDPGCPADVRLDNHPAAFPMTGVTVESRQNLPTGDIRHHLGLPVYSPPIHQSMMAAWWTCPRYYFFRYRLGLRPRDRVPGALDAGKFFHKCLEVLYLGGTLQEASTAIGGLLDRRQQKLRQVGVELGKEDIAESRCDTTERLASLGLAMGVLFHDHHPIDPNKYTVVQCEVTIPEIRIPEIGYTGGGTIDQLLYCKATQGLYIFDHKTVRSGENLTEYAEHLPYDFQARWYRRLAQALVGAIRGVHSIEFPVPGIPGETLWIDDIPVIGFVLNAMVKPGVERKSWQSDDQWMAECTDYYLARRGPVEHHLHADPFKKDGSPRKGVDKDGYILDSETDQRKEFVLWDHSSKAVDWALSPPWKQFLVRFHEPVMPPELKLIASLVAKAARCRPTLDNYPRFGELTGSCRYMYGRPCMYHRLCPLNAHLWEGVIAQDFEAKDPLEREDD